MPRLSGETYFFRDHGQFNLLQRKILPSLIKQRSKERSLRIWSAGCSSGEEPYSLAMLIDMLLPERSEWDIFILGSDINQIFLEKALRGRYTQWSFRMMPMLLQARYFEHENHEWVLKEHIRQMVTFRNLNLITHSFQNMELENMDLILCRNVFIYFEPIEVKVVAKKLARSLRNEGYLLTAHTELIGHDIQILQSQLHPEGVIYQHREFTPITKASLPSYVEPLVQVLPKILASPICVPVIELPVVPSTESLLELAYEYANQGEYDKAHKICEQLVITEPFLAKTYFLLGQIAQIKGDFEEAIKLLNKVIYLDFEFVAAYFELSALYERDKNLPKARALQNTALKLLQDVGT